MKTLFLSLLLAACYSSYAALPAGIKEQSAPFCFTENKGQVADEDGRQMPDVLFTARRGEVQLFITATGIHYQLRRTVYPEGFEPDDRQVQDRGRQEALRRDIKTSTHHFSLTLAGANPHPRVSKAAQGAYYENFYLSHCPQGITGVPTYSRVVLEEVYPGIDWILYANDQGMKYDFLVKPGADPSLIRLQVQDADEAAVSSKGELVMKTRLGEVKEAAPVSFAAGKQVATRFVQDKEGTVRFALAGYDKEAALTIDPSISWATYYAASWNDEHAYGCATDYSGNVYITGETASMTGLGYAGFRNTSGGSFDAYLAKFNSQGVRLWATYYGGASAEIAYDCATDHSNNVYITGLTASASGVAAGGFQNTRGGGTFDNDAFLVKFTGSGTRLWATYYGGSSQDIGLACTVDRSDNVYMAGQTSSDTGIAVSGFRSVLSRPLTGQPADAYLVKFNSSGTRLWATYYGGTNDEWAYGCTTDGSNNVYLTGTTASDTGIASGGFQNARAGNDDAFLVKFDSLGIRLWGTYYGGSGPDIGRSCASDGKGKLFLAGTTGSAGGIATTGAFQDTIGSTGSGSKDAFLVRFDELGNRIWGTYYGGARNDQGTRCAIDQYEHVYLCGSSNSVTNIAFHGFRDTLIVSNGNSNAFIARFNVTGRREWGSYFGGPGGETGLSCAVFGNGNIYLAGDTHSLTGIATPGAYMDTLFTNSFGGGGNGFLAKISDSTIFPPIPNAVHTTVPAAAIALYPNPNHGAFTLTIAHAAGGEAVEIIDMTGRRIWRAALPLAAGNSTVPVRLGAAAAGLYLLRLSAATGQSSVQSFEVIR